MPEDDEILASNNPFPSVLMEEQDDPPTSPSAGFQRPFIHSPDHHLKRVDENDVVVDVEVEQAVVTADPAAPADGTVWFFDDGGSPATLYVKWRRGGVTHVLPIGTV